MLNRIFGIAFDLKSFLHIGHVLKFTEQELQKMFMHSAQLTAVFMSTWQIGQRKRYIPGLSIAVSSVATIFCLSSPDISYE